ncbi:hypothetical protein ACI8AA_02595 [Geodermatophilus sp. SYSU D01180]
MDSTEQPAASQGHVRTPRTPSADVTRERLRKAPLGPSLNADTLLASARRHARRGFRARAAGEHDDASLQFGTMLEHLAKSYLASVHPTLLVESRLDFLSLVRLTGQGPQLKPGHVLRTVGLQGALERIGTLVSSGNEAAGRAYAKRFDLVTQARNGVAHVGDDGGAADEVAQLAVRGATDIAEKMSRGVYSVFGEYTAAAEALLDEHATVVHQTVALRLIRAMGAFKERFAGLSANDHQTELQAINRLTTLSHIGSDDHRPIECPACNQTGVLSGEADIDYEADETGAGTSATVVLKALSFRCPVCRLTLQGVEELSEGGFSINRVLREATETDYASFAFSTTTASKSV